ncbi:carboxylesterase/lipase family protein [Hoyosella rhizosphaerae]|nr:carboxylesterase/lipase family protein [Hoyosella rhizosphaerae]
MDRTRSSVDITTKGGVVRGRRDGDVVTWRGIPYAEPPVGELRFRAPVPSEPWSGVRDAAEFGSIPPQEVKKTFTNSDDVGVSEDCLTINVSAPARTSAAPLPVMVYIYGGSFTSGSSALDVYDGSVLAANGDVVYVSFNYRLGALGFLDFSAYNSSRRQFDTNVGLLDQVAALEWVRDNISAFGGDPDNVTLFGESAGAISVAALMTIPRTRGLFAKAIMQSPAMDTTYDRDRSRAVAAEFLDILNVCEDHAAEALGRIPAEEFVHAADELKQRRLQSTPGAMTFSLVLDDVVRERPGDVFRRGGAHPVPLIIGTTDREGALFAKTGDVIPTTEPQIERMFAETDPGKRDAVVSAYPGYPARPAATDIGGDVLFWHPTVEAAAGHSDVAPTFMYRYDFAPRMLRILRMGATHATDLPAVFGTLDSRAAKVLTSVGGKNQLASVSQRMQRRWVNFAYTGSPDVGWPTYDVDTRSTKIFDTNERVDDDPRAERRTAWSGYHNYR